MHEFRLHRRTTERHAIAARQAYNHGPDHPTTDYPWGPFEDDTVPGPSFVLTGPITIVVTRTVYTTPTHPVYDAPNPVMSTTSPTSEPPAPSPTLETPDSDAVTMASPLPDVLSGEDTSTEETPEPVSGAGKPGLSRMTSGAIIGVVIGIIVILSAVVFFFLRRRYVARRKQLRKEWSHSKSVKARSTSESKFPELAGSPLSNLSPSTSSLRSGRLGSPTMARTRPGDAPGTPVISFMAIPAPPASYGTDFSSVTPRYRPGVVPNIMSSPLKPTGASPVKKVVTPLYGPPSAGLSGPSNATVVSTFITTLPDELQISVGETIDVVSEFDDGWAMCKNSKGEQGVVPMECLDRGIPNLPNMDHLPRTAGGKLKRISSLRPQGYGDWRF